MGSIYSINRRPSTWPVDERGWRLKPELGGEEVLTVEYGTLDDDPGGICPLEMLMRRSVYDGCVSGEYRVDPKAWNSLVLIDRNGKIVPPIDPQHIY